ncbi:MAG: hypothetical protein GY943_36730, partial [Chloroflexi bacterium]|nr:hypothetical protein [Chloroflexota bacterium]
MTKQVDLHNIERDTRRLFSEDGLIYLFLGILIALVGLGFYDTRLSVFGGLAALLYFPLKAARERITYPRIGYVEFTPPAGFGRGILTFLIIAVVTLSLIAFVGNGRFQSIMP